MPCRSSRARARRILGRHEVEELLAAEARLHRHQQQHVELGQQVLVGLDRGGRLERHAGPGAVAADLAGQPDRGGGRLDVEGDRAAARLDVRQRRCRSGSSIIRCASSGRSVDRASASTIVGPNVRFGTKWLSITSTCTQSALPIRATSAPRSAKSAFRMLGVIWRPTGDDPRGCPRRLASGSGSAGGSAPARSSRSAHSSSGAMSKTWSSMSACRSPSSANRSRHREDREVARVDVVDLVPADRGRDPGVGQPAHGVRRRDRVVARVLVVVDEQRGAGRGPCATRWW